MKVVLVLGLAAGCLAHGAVTFPPPRQAVDGSLAPWNGTVPFPVPFEFWCASPSASSSQPRNLTGSNGQACFWFSNGCDISCDKCDGNTGQAIHPTYIYTGKGTVPSWSGEGIVPDPKNPTKPKPICANPLRNATICDPNLRTINTDAECGSPQDFFYYSPWRHPGSAPVIDSCGTAGGRLPGQGPGTAGADYRPTIHAKRGDLGSKVLKPAPSGTVWTTGQHVEVAWTVKAFHGGGYQYRLCPLDHELNEACFQSTPLKYVGQSSLRWGGVGGERLYFNATDVSVGTVPIGSTWRKNPVPRGPWGWKGVSGGGSPEPICDEPAACRNAHYKNPKQLTCRCSGDGIGDIPNLEIVDTVAIPKGLTPGEWVLGWRWDCEESTQVWSSCSDVTIRKGQ